MRIFALIAAIWAGPVAAQAVPDAAVLADVVVLGEIHDNPAHHDLQAQWVAHIAPSAIVMEMLTPEQAALITPETRQDPEMLGDLLGWEQAGWPDFAMYSPILVAAADARIYGAAVPRDVARASMTDGIAATFGADAGDYGLHRALPADQQVARIALQDQAHCNAMPPDMLPAMVDIQRLRDATLARAVAQAMIDTSGAVVVITGNGHARKDWGMPSILDGVLPNAIIFSLGQTEDDAPMDGAFDLVLSAKGVVRPDPCDAFR